MPPQVDATVETNATIAQSPFGMRLRLLGIVIVEIALGSFQFTVLNRSECMDRNRKAGVHRHRRGYLRRGGKRGKNATG
jgi:hypothetical protein